MKKIFIYTILIIILFELTARVFHYPFRFKEANKQQEQPIIEELKSKGKFTLFDYSLGVDTIQEVSHNGIEYVVTNLSDKSRYTGFNNSKQKIEIYGCSYCFGVGLNDQQTLGFKLQQKYDSLKVKNYCISAAGIPTIFAKFLKEIDKSTEVVIINYCNFQQERQTYSRWMSKIIARSTTKNGFKILQENMLVPVIESDSIVYKPIKSINLQLVKRSALANWADNQLLHWHKQRQDYTTKIAETFVIMQEICDAKGIEFAVNNGDGHINTKMHFEIFKKYGINLIDLGIDIGDQKYNLIIDSHPNEVANQEFAIGLHEYLDSKLK